MEVSPFSFFSLCISGTTAISRVVKHGRARIPFLRLAAILSFLFAPVCLDQSSAHAQAPATQSIPKQNGKAADTREIPVDRPVADEALQQRISSVFSSIEDLKDIQVEVRNGVVTLTGETVSARASERAQTLASRFQGVAYVQNGITQETQVESRLAPAVKKIDQYVNSTIRQLPVIAVALIVGASFWFLSALITRWDRPYKFLGINTLLLNMLRQFLRAAVFMVGLLIVFDILDVTALVGALIGTAGVIGIAIGFAFRDIVENYLSGMLLSLRSPFSVNDLVTIASHEGKILRMTTRETILMTLEGNHVRIPNATVFKSVICNFTRNPRRRFDFPVGVGMEEDLSLVQDVGCRTLRAMEGVLEDPAPFMRVEELGAFSVNVRFFGWIDQVHVDWFKVKSEAVRLVKNALDESAITMPTETYTVLLRENAPPAMSAGRGKSRLSSATLQDAQKADVAVDRRLDEEIEKELTGSDEENLLVKDGSKHRDSDKR